VPRPSKGRVETVLEAICDAVSALEDGRAPKLVICEHLARAVQATWGAYVVLEPSRTIRSLVCWPSALDAERLALVSSLARVMHPESVRALNAGSSPSASRVGDNVVAVPLSASHGEIRILALASSGRFAAWHLEMLRFAQGPLTALDVHLSQLDRPRPRSTSFDPVLVSLEYGLTARELEALAFLAQGLSARTIAARMGLSPRTVNKHLGNLYRKLGTHDRLMAVSKAHDLGLLGSSAVTLSWTG
jgi:DNA-binding CsgD family transcriptional regulator